MTDPNAIPVVSFRFIVKQSLTKLSRRNLAERMVSMCQLSGWRDTTLNPEMSSKTKMSILTNRYGKIITAEDDAEQLYTELIALSAVTMGWAQSIVRRQKQEQRQQEKQEQKKNKKDKKS
jgi:hypothetical protein